MGDAGPVRIPTSQGEIRRYHVMVKPTGPLCNLDCAYCYYLHKAELLGTNSNFRISDEILETHIRQYTEGQNADEVVFTWQGGEPTLLGLPFFEKVIALQQKYKRTGQCIVNDLQTNGTLIDEHWCRFLKKHNFLVGLSIDGPEELHDAYRRAKDGKPTFKKVFAASQLLHKYNVRFNSLTVVNHLNAKRPLDVYRFLSREVEPHEIQFLPCVEPKNFRFVAPQQWEATMLPPLHSSATRPGNPDSILTDWSVDADDWGTFLCKVWDEWYRRDYGRVFVNLFETAVAQWMGMDSQICVYHEFCGKSVVLEHDGAVYSCDHYVYPEYKLADVLHTSSSEMVFSDWQKHFGFNKFVSLPQHCRQCEFLFACNGECPKNRLIRTPGGDAGLNYLCPGLKKFWAHIDPIMPEIRKRIAMEQQSVI
ncbi:MAG: anaerobic sulfatase maturase [Acidobacteriia bacterium]|nr:anaerobic sulfatase maturase [Terriglobia bacterium]MBZ5722753.1 anaerobic sulfatase maturase [Terriglobia bacterium]